MEHASDIIAEGLAELEQQGKIAPPVNGSDTTGTAPVEAIASAMTMVGQQFAAANKHERMAENPDDFVFDGPFDAQRAIDEIFRLNREVTDASKDLDRAKDQAKKMRDAYDEKVTSLTNRMKELEAWERGEDGMQPRLRTLSEQERADETIDARRARLAEQLQTKQCYITADELTGLDRTQLDALDAWLTMPDGVVVPEVLAKAHVADPEGLCVNCGVRLALDDKAYPKDAFVGLDCQAPARKPAKARKRRRGTPEAEAATQQAAGIEMVCQPRGHGKNEIGHVWDSNEPDALCQCGAKRYDGQPLEAQG